MYIIIRECNMNDHDIFDVMDSTYADACEDVVIDELNARQLASIKLTMLAVLARTNYAS